MSLPLRLGASVVFPLGCIDCSNKQETYRARRGAPPPNANLFVKRDPLGYVSNVFSLTMLGSGSAGNAALVSTDHCRLLIDGGLSGRQLVLRLALCGVRPEQLDGVLLTHEHGDHICGLEVLCRKYQVPIYCNALTAEAIRCGGLAQHRNWRLFRTGAEFSICDITVQTFPVPHDAVEPVGYALHAGGCGLGFCLLYTSPSPRDS